MEGTVIYVEAVRKLVVDGGGNDKEIACHNGLLVLNDVLGNRSGVHQCAVSVDVVRYVIVDNEIGKGNGCLQLGVVVLR